MGQGGASPSFFRPPYPAAQTQRPNTRTHEPRASTCGKFSQSRQRHSRTIGRPLCFETNPTSSRLFQVSFSRDFSNNERVARALRRSSSLFSINFRRHVQPTSIFLPFSCPFTCCFFRCASPIRPLLSWMGPTRALAGAHNIPRFSPLAPGTSAKHVASVEIPCHTCEGTRAPRHRPGKTFKLRGTRIISQDWVIISLRG